MIFHINKEMVLAYKMHRQQFNELIAKKDRTDTEEANLKMIESSVIDIAIRIADMCDKQTEENK
jgi:hypothetical protein